MSEVKNGKSYDRVTPLNQAVKEELFLEPGHLCEFQRDGIGQNPGA